VGGKWFLNAVFVLMILGVAALLVEQIWSKAQSSDMFRVHAWQWNTSLPPWMLLTKDDITEQLKQDDFLIRRHSIFDNNLERDIAARYETLPYIRGVTRMQKSYPNSLSVAVEWRVPAAKVRCAGGEWLVDGDGVVLESVYDNGVERKPVYDESRLDYALPVIEGFSSATPMPVPGKPWPMEDVVIAARMAEFLRPLLKDLARISNDQAVDPISVIDVRNLGDRRKSRILLLTNGGKVFEWGNPVGEETSNEPRPEKKRANLEKIYAHSAVLAAYKDQPLKTWIALQWFDDEIVTSDGE
jgi:hypothetical protein